MTTLALITLTNRRSAGPLVGMTVLAFAIGYAYRNITIRSDRLKELERITIYDDPPSITVNLAAIQAINDLWDKKAADTGSMDIKLALREQRLVDAGVIEGPESKEPERVVKYRRRSKRGRNDGTDIPS